MTPPAFELYHLSTARQSSDTASADFLRRPSLRRKLDLRISSTPPPRPSPAPPRTDHETRTHLDIRQHTAGSSFVLTIASTNPSQRRKAHSRRPCFEQLNDIRTAVAGLLNNRFAGPWASDRPQNPGYGGIPHQRCIVSPCPPRTASECSQRRRKAPSR